MQEKKREDIQREALEARKKELFFREEVQKLREQVDRLEH